ncbi:hypothetical protein [Vandammella animalimorsus]|nr:hypothetical protein [Vandammella animalimorsus]
MKGDKNALLELMRHLDNPQELRPWAMLLANLQLQDLRRKGLRSAQLSAGRVGPRLCPACQALDGQIISTQASALAVVPADCTCSRPGMLTPQGWIKYPDGREGIDR